jgi:hypothetical protein
MRPCLSQIGVVSSVSVPREGSSRIVDNRLDDLPECALPELNAVLPWVSRKSCSNEVRGPVCCRSEAP